AECAQSSPTEVYARQVFVGLFSLLLGSLPQIVFLALQTRQFVDRKRYRRLTSIQWQLRRWDLEDMVVIFMAAVYCAACYLYLILFLANISDVAERKWIIGVSTGVISDYMIKPIGLTIVLVAVALGVLSTRPYILEMATADVFFQSRSDVGGGAAKEIQEIQETIISLVESHQESDDSNSGTHAAPQVFGNQESEPPPPPAVPSPKRPEFAGPPLPGSIVEEGEGTIINILCVTGSKSVPSPSSMPREVERTLEIPAVPKCSHCASRLKYLKHQDLCPICGRL
ncbi:unnamed protein product, partial [Polarella glacialis]